MIVGDGGDQHQVVDCAELYSFVVFDKPITIYQNKRDTKHSDTFHVEI